MKVPPYIMRAGRFFLGCDPELFLTNADGIIGAEKVIDSKGILASNGAAVLDGVQLELHPAPSTCRQTLAANIANIFQAISTALTHRTDGIKVSFDPVVTVSKKELDTLSEQAKKLGCSPSLNTHKPNAILKVAKCNERMRSAGGHLHLAAGPQFHGPLGPDRKPTDNADTIRFVNLLDIFVGLPSVLIDRDPNASKRRRVYGRAGEHRLPPYGVEYRTLSNFWLRNYILMSFVFGQARQAYNVYMSSTPGKKFDYIKGQYIPEFDFYADLLKRIKMKDVAKAINRNDLDLAWKLWDEVSAFIIEFHPSSFDGVCSTNINNFNWWAKDIAEHGLEKWFPDDPLTHWCAKGMNPPGWAGFESYISGRQIGRLPCVKIPVVGIKKAA